MSNILISDNLHISATAYASQGNAILGIRDAGKTYTAMKAAEQLLDAGIPIICFDPVGVWKNLKVGTGTHKGYPVVVAGGPGSDILLTEKNAVDIVRAAMKEKVSLVIDLYSPELANKSKWIRIVQETVDLLMYENKTHELRHIFLEEAAEFIPQRLQPQHGKVYSAIERLARMGRNARLGMTIVNQRSEEVNKAILEICAFSLLHKQVGKNSLKSIQQWLEVRQLANVKQIVATLPTLKQGECWAIGMTEEATLIKVSPRNTFHPDPSKAGKVTTTAKVIDVSGFVEKMNLALQVVEADDKPEVKLHTAQGEKLREQEVNYLKVQLEEKEKQGERIARKYAFIQKRLEGVIQLAEAIMEDLAQEDHTNQRNDKEKQSNGKNAAISAPNDTESVKKVAKSDEKVPETEKESTHLHIGERRILTACAQFKNGLSRDQLTVIAGYKRSSRDAYIQRLKGKGLLEQMGDRLYPTIKGRKELGDDFEPLPTGKALQQHWLKILPQGEKAVLEILISAFPHWVSRDIISERTGYQRSSRDAYIQRMAAKELVVTGKGEVVANSNLF